MPVERAESLGDLIHNLRRGRGLTQKQLAERIGTGYSHVSKWERNDHVPSDDYLPKLAEALSVPVDIIKRQIIRDRQKNDMVMEDSYSTYSASKRDMLQNLQAAAYFIQKAIEQLKNEEDL